MLSFLLLSYLGNFVKNQSNINIRIYFWNLSSLHWYHTCYTEHILFITVASYCVLELGVSPLTLLFFSKLLGYSRSFDFHIKLGSACFSFLKASWYFEKDCMDSIYQFQENCCVNNVEPASPWACAVSHFILFSKQCFATLFKSYTS